jgi:hypothetical protein
MRYFIRGKVALKKQATSVIFKKRPKVNNRPMGKNSPHLVTLLCIHKDYGTCVCPFSSLSVRMYVHKGGSLPPICMMSVHACLSRESLERALKQTDLRVCIYSSKIFVESFLEGLKNTIMLFTIFQ